MQLKCCILILQLLMELLLLILEKTQHGRNIGMIILALVQHLRLHRQLLQRRLQHLHRQLLNRQLLNRQLLNRQLLNRQLHQNQHSHHMTAVVVAVVVAMVAALSETRK
jgi:hypothetical protein